MRRAAWLVVIACGPAHADEDAPSVTLRARPSWERTDGPLLQLDDKLLGTGATRHREVTLIRLGSRAQLLAEGQWWSGTRSPDALASHELEDVERGWRTGFELSYDLGPFRVGASAALGHTDGRFGRGTYQFAGVSIHRTFRLSRWMRAWISLGAGRRQWLGTPPQNESNDSTIGLTIGTTFR
jgi:hypothetical protein